MVDYVVQIKTHFRSSVCPWGQRSLSKILNMRGSRNFCQRGCISIYVFLVNEGRREDPKNTKKRDIISPSAKRLNGIWILSLLSPLINQKVVKVGSHLTKLSGSAHVAMINIISDRHFDVRHGQEYLACADPEKLPGGGGPSLNYIFWVF